MVTRGINTGVTCGQGPFGDNGHDLSALPNLWNIGAVEGEAHSEGHGWDFGARSTGEFPLSPVAMHHQEPTFG